MYDINQRIVNANGVTLTSVRAINNAGQIAALGRRAHPNPFYGISDVIVRLVPRPPQPADLNDDCRVNGFELALLIDAWGPVAAKQGVRAAAAADLDHNGIVNGLDLAMLLGAWG